MTTTTTLSEATGEQSATIFFGILEIENRPSRTPLDLFIDATAHLRASSFAGHKVIGVMPRHGEPLLIPYFGHGVGNADGQPLAHGVSRWFGMDVVLVGGRDGGLLGTWEIRPGVRFEITGYGTMERKHVERERQAE